MNNGSNTVDVYFLFMEASKVYCPSLVCGFSSGWFLLSYDFHSLWPVEKKREDIGSTLSFLKDLTWSGISIQHSPGELLVHDYFLLHSLQSHEHAYPFSEVITIIVLWIFVILACLSYLYIHMLLSNNSLVFLIYINYLCYGVLLFSRGG